jgi:hypothetical protein
LRRTIVIALVAIGMLATASTAQATPWTVWRSNYIQAHHIHFPQVGEDRTPFQERAIELIRVRNHTIWAKYMHARAVWKADHQPVVHVQVQRYVPPQHYGHGSLQAMVCSFNWSCSIASCIVGRESGWNPYATNRYSGAAGLFQLMPSHWRGKFDPYNPYLNASYAYHDLYLPSHSWSAWAGGQYSCF